MYAQGQPTSYQPSGSSQRVPSRVVDPMQSFMNSLAPAHLQVRSLSTSSAPLPTYNVGQKRQRVEPNGSNGGTVSQTSRNPEPLPTSDLWYGYNMVYPTTDGTVNVSRAPKAAMPLVMGWPPHISGPLLTPPSAFETLLLPTGPTPKSRSSKAATAPPSPRLSYSSSRPTSLPALSFTPTPTQPETTPNHSRLLRALQDHDQQQRPACSRTHFSHIKCHSSLGLLNTHLQPQKQLKRARHLSEGLEIAPPNLPVPQKPVDGKPKTQLTSDLFKLDPTFPPDQEARTPARLDPPYSAAIQENADALLLLIEERIQAGVNAMVVRIQAEVEEELEGKKRWVMDETRSLGEERIKAEDERKEVEERLRNEQIKLEEERRAVDEQQRAINERWRAVEKETQGVNEAKKSDTILENQRAVEIQRRAFEQEQQRLEELRREVERERSLLVDERKALQELQMAIEDEKRVWELDQKALQEERENLLSDLANSNAQKLAILEDKAELARRMDAAAEERKIVEEARRQAAEEQ